jgi:hypothetical protein
MRGDERRRHAWVAGVVTTLALLAACSDPSNGSTTTDPTDPTDPSDHPTEVATPTEPTPTPSAVVDPEHATDPPGEVQTPLLSADIMVVGSGTLDPALVKRISRLEGVAATTTISLKQVPIENRLYDIAAVDAAEYRRFTEARSAQLQPQWDRVAGGEIASTEELQKRLPLDPDGFLTLDVAADAPRIHVAAYAPQVPTIELVVNEKWGESLGIDQRNALVISTQPTSPQSLQKPIQRLVGDAGSVQMMDIASQLGLDPEAAQSVELVGTYADAVGTFRYTLAGGRVIPDPSWVREHIVTATVPILGQVTCNKYLIPQLKAALGEIVSRGLTDEIHPGEYAGCYYPRFIAGTTQLSNHAFGLALDLNVPGNQRGTVGQMDRGVVDVFKKWGFGWGGDWSYTDPMHFELNRIVNPG